MSASDGRQPPTNVGIIKQLWPSVNTALQDVVKKQLIPLLHRKLKILKKILMVNKLHIGTETPKITSVFVHPKSENRQDIVLDVDIEYKGNAEIEASLLPVCFGVKDIELSGRLRVLLGPLIPTFPLFAGLSVFFIRPPVIKYDLTGLANIGDFPGIKKIVREGVNDAISKELVYPNRKVAILSKDSGLTKEQLEHPDPQGMLRVTVVSINNVDDTDFFSKPDIYVVTKIGGLEFRTKTAKNVWSAKFNTTFDALLDEYEDCILTVEVWDEDIRNDDPLGCADINLSRVKGTPDVHLPLRNSKNGSIQMKIEWCEISLQPAGEVLSAASSRDLLLFVDLKELKGVDTSGEHHYQCDVQVGTSPDLVQTTKMAVLEGKGSDQTFSFNKHLQFLVNQTDELPLVVKVVDSFPDDDDIIVGQFSVKMKDIFESCGSLLEKVFPLDGQEGKGVEARLLLRAFEVTS